MLRLLAGLSLMSSAVAIARAPEPVEAPVAAAQSPSRPEAPEVAEVPKMKKVCRTIQMVGSAIPKKICTMRPIKPSKPSN